MGGIGGFQTVKSSSQSSLPCCHDIFFVFEKNCLYKVVNDAGFSPDGQKAGQFGSDPSIAISMGGNLRFR